MKYLDNKQWAVAKGNQKGHDRYGMDAMDPMNICVTLNGNQIQWMIDKKVKPEHFIKALFAFVEGIDTFDSDQDSVMLLDLKPTWAEEPYTVNMNGYIEQICGQGYGAWMDGAKEQLSGRVGYMEDSDWEMLELICIQYLWAVVPFMRWQEPKNKIAKTVCPTCGHVVDPEWHDHADDPRFGQKD
jgi:hypothetical protein